MRASLAVSLSIMVASFAGLALVGMAPARADTAERCGWRGCSYIHCNWTGDRCYRIDEHGRYCGFYGEGCGYGYSYGYGAYGYRYGDDRRDYRWRGERYDGWRGEGDYRYDRYRRGGYDDYED
jgi:hypothetical protein